MVIGRDEIELLRHELVDNITAVHPGCDVSTDARFIIDAVTRATADWTAYRVRTYDHGQLEERWQIRSSWRPVIVDGTQGTITGRMHTKKPAIQDAGPSRRLQRSDEEKP